MSRHFKIRKVRQDGVSRYDVVARSDTEPEVEDVINTFPGTERGFRLAKAYVFDVEARNAGLERES